MAAKNVVSKAWGIAPSADGKRYSAWPAGDKPVGGDGYYVDFTTKTAENPVSQGGIWVNNAGGAGQPAMGSQDSLQIGLADDDATMILKHGAADAVDYKDPFGFVPGIPGSQRITMTMYRGTGYNPGTGHEWHAWHGAKVRGADDKICVSVSLYANGSSQIALLSGSRSNYFLLGSIVQNLQPDTGDQMISELDVAAKTCKLWLKKGTSAAQLLNQCAWTTTGGAITTEVKTILDNDLEDGCGAGSYKPPGGDIDAFGALDFLMEAL